MRRRSSLPESRLILEADDIASAKGCRAPVHRLRELRSTREEVTARELETLRYLARGLSNAKVAREASVSETTVKTHIAHSL